MKKTCYSIFSGCGGSDRGMIDAGYLSLGGIEYHQPAADIYNLNHLIPVAVADVMEIDSIPTVDLLWCSPPCPSFSIANPNRGETDRDLDLARHIAHLIVTSRPRNIAIENVRAYAASRSFDILIGALATAGYTVDSRIYCAANYGAPTTRERLIVRASLVRLGDVVITHASSRSQLPLFPLPNWVSWWEVIADRLGTLPRSKLTANQKAVLEKQGLADLLLVDGGGNSRHRSYTVRTHDRPAHTITATIGKHPVRILVDLNNPRVSAEPFRRENRYTVLSGDKPAHTITAGAGSKYNFATRVLIERVGYYGGEPNIYVDNAPAPTIRAHTSIDGYRGSYRVSHNIWDGFECYSADIKCLAAWQGFPNDYQWGDNKGAAGRAIGNAVPPPLAEAIALSFGGEPR